MEQKRSHVDSSCIVAWYHICQHTCHSNALVFCQSIITNTQLSCVACYVYTGKKPKSSWIFENSFCGRSNLLLEYWLIGHAFTALFSLAKFILPCQLYCQWATQILEHTVVFRNYSLLYHQYSLLIFDSSFGFSEYSLPGKYCFICHPTAEVTSRLPIQNICMLQPFFVF